MAQPVTDSPPHPEALDKVDLCGKLCEAQCKEKNAQDYVEEMKKELHKANEELAMVRRGRQPCVGFNLKLDDAEYLVKDFGIKYCETQDKLREARQETVRLERMLHELTTQPATAEERATELAATEARASELTAAEERASQLAVQLATAEARAAAAEARAAAAEDSANANLIALLDAQNRAEAMALDGQP